VKGAVWLNGCSLADPSCEIDAALSRYSPTRVGVSLQAVAAAGLADPSLPADLCRRRLIFSLPTMNAFCAPKTFDDAGA
jgi:hypothetical protein